MNERQRILLVRLDAIGDWILSRNALRALRHSPRYAEAHFTILGNPAWRGLAEAFDRDLADEWIWVDNRGDLFRKGYENLLPRAIWHRRVARAQQRLRASLRQYGFDEVISPQPIRDPLLDELVSGIAPTTIGVASATPFTTDGVYTNLIETGPDSFVFERNKHFAEGLTGKKCDIALALGTPKRKQERSGVFICLGASHWSRILPARRYLDVCDMILKETAHHVFIAGGKKDVGVATFIRRKSAFPSRVTVLAGKLTLAQFANEISKAKCAICNDTGSMHIAAATGTPTVCIANGISGKDGFWPYPDGRIDLVLPKAPPIHRSRVLPIFQLQIYAAFSSITAEEIFNVARRHL